MMKKIKQKFGAHMSIAGGLYQAFARAEFIGCDCLQVFVKNQRQWASKPLSQADIQAWRHAAQKTGIAPVFAHAIYLINLGSPDTALWKKSVSALTVELERCEALGIAFLIFHPGSHLKAPFEEGTRQIVKGVDEIHKRTPGIRSRLLLETTAGQGTSIGYRFRHLARIISDLKEPSRVDVCVDTCHIFAAGYPLSEVEDYEATVQHFDEEVGLKRIKCFHLNDSKTELGSRVDRHEHIGQGKIGMAGFRNLVNDPRLQDIPKIIETPKGQNERGRDFDKLNLRRLRRAVNAR